MIMIIFGFVLIILLYLKVSYDSSEKEKYRKAVETENIITHQAFILSVKNIYPNFQLKILGDKVIIFEGPLQYNQKKVGKIEIQGFLNRYYSKSSDYKVSVCVKIGTLNFEEDKSAVKNDMETLTNIISNLVDAVMANQEIKVRLVTSLY